MDRALLFPLLAATAAWCVDVTTAAGEARAPWPVALAAFLAWLAASAAAVARLTRRGE
ncbi:unnamed protein product [Urochloa decumbens]|uniref:Uncharacterized protein n=1 Tax=Urochloa decumbens TaxID=240449 RepID=A0ABC8VF90_9POAL